jgi:PhnB protein
MAHALTPYLAFNDGQCREAMNFYKACIGGEVNFTTFENMPGSDPKFKDLIAHAHLQCGAFVLFASDGRPSQPSKVGENVALYLKLDSNTEVDALYAKLAKGGTATMPATQQPWGSYFGMETDKYKIHWMLAHETPHK